MSPPALFRAAERYEILGEHGRGGLGRVSRAHDRELGRDVAIKELIARTAINEIRFLREAMITARLEHPGIVPMYEASRWPDGTPYYAMKLVSGRPLRDLIAERTTVDQRIGLLHHVIAVADAIAYAHGRNIIHRDLKPANVIVGEFGETIVIDWGLAKDLSTVEVGSVGGGPLRTAPPPSDLTAVGAVLGTPSYMAPEQERGEYVDQRADVFAIGAMLWELCSVEKIPLADLRLRHRVLRRAGIDADLAIIIDKALDPDPGLRYRDAGALAADLKAFKSGARISARSYSAWARLTHWARHHRAIAVSIAIATVVSAVGVVLYIRNIAAERDRADLSQNAAVASLNELTLKHAELLLTSDPSAALDALASYRGANLIRAGQIRAEARGRGAAALRVVPHTDAVFWLRGTAQGDVVSLSIDGTIVRTSRDGRSDVIANDVQPGGIFAYAKSRHLLAYACNPNDLCMLEITTGRRAREPQSSGDKLLGLSFSPDERQLALLSEAGDLRVLELDFPAPSKELARIDSTEAGGVLFVDRDVIALGTSDGLKLVNLPGAIRELRDPDSTLWEIAPGGKQLVLATRTGHIYLVDTGGLQVTMRTQPCRDRVSGLAAIPSRGPIAVACKEGAIGLVDPTNGTMAVKTQLDGHANLLRAGSSGDYLVAAGDKGTLAVLDLRTSITTTLQGQGFRLTAISPPTDEYPLFLSADVHGGIRAWPPPVRIVKALGDARPRVYSAMYSRQTHSLILSTWASELLSYTEASGVQLVSEHTFDVPYIAPASSGHAFALFGSNGAVEIWSLSPLAKTRTLDTHGPVSHVEFVHDTEDVLTSGKDGRLVRWSSSGESRVVHRFDQPIETFGLIAGDDSVLVATQDGALWALWSGGKDAGATAIRPAGARVTRLLPLPDGASILVGYSDGTVSVLDTRRQQTWTAMKAQGAVRDMVATRDGRIVALSGGDNTIRIGARHGDTWATAAWTDLSINVRRIALTRDGVLIAIGNDGLVWLYSSAHATWLCLPTGTTELTHVILDDTERTAFVLDADGHLMSIDLEQGRKMLDDTNTN